MHTGFEASSCCSVALGFSRETEPFDMVDMIQKEIDYEGLAGMIPENTCHVPSAHWKPRKASGVVPAQVLGERAY